MRSPRLLPTLYVVGGVLTAVIVAPLARPGYLLSRDAVSTPRSFVTDAALGVGPLAPRAVPQDWFVAVLTSTAGGGGGVVVAVLLAAALLFAGVGYGRLAFRLVPSAGRSGAVAAAVVAIWNPFVGERLLQGHWGLLAGYAALGWIAVAVIDLVAQPHSAVRWVQLGGLLAAAGLTPTGSVLGGTVLVVAVLMSGVQRSGVQRSGVQGSGIGGRILPGVVGIWLLSALPWVVSTAVGGASVASDGGAGVRAFGLRPEPLLGPVGTALGLGGIWNADAVPASRTIWWAAVATCCFVLVLTVGSVALWRNRIGGNRQGSPMIGGLAGVAALAVLAVILTSFGPGQSALATLIDEIAGAGLLRDTQKFLALTMPFVAVAAAAAVGSVRRWFPSGFAVAAVIVLLVAPLPDLAWGVGGKISPVTYPHDWARVADIVPADAGAVALWPPGTVRQYPYASTTSLDPAARMLRAPVVESGELTVDGVVVDPANSTAAQVQDTLAGGGDPAALARLGVGWVLVENLSGTGAADLPSGVSSLTPTFRGTDLVLFRIDGGRTERASGLARGLAWSAHLIWLAMLIAGACACAPLIARQRNRSP